MLTNINHINVVTLLFFIIASLINAAQIDLADSRHLNVAKVTKPSGTVTVSSQIQPSVLLVTNDKDEFKDGAGFRVIGKYWFSAIGIGIVEIPIPYNVSEKELLDKLQSRFPATIAALNDTIVPLGTAIHDSVPTSSRRLGDNLCFANQRIGVIDGRINSGHAIFEGHSIVRKSFVANQASSSAHSTAVLSILVETYAQGSSRPLNILVAEILEHRDTGVAGSLLSTIRALDWLVGEGATVVNMSFQSADNAVFSKVLDLVAERGTIMVAAAGDQRSGIEMNYPAAHPKVIAVTAIDSSRNASSNASRGEYIDFAAPGVNVPIATLHGTGRGSGTSYAAPYVTSVVALTLEEGAPRDVDRIRRLIARNAIDLGVPGKDDIFGWGLPKVEAHCGQGQTSRH